MPPIILLSCVRNKKDPLCYGGGRYFNQLGRELAERLGGPCVISMPRQSRLDIVEGLALPDWEIAVSDQALPQQRLRELMARRGWDAVVALSSYSLFVDLENLRGCAEQLNGRAFLEFGPWCPPNFFCLIGAELAERLADSARFPVAPFAIPYYARKLLDGDRAALVRNPSPHARAVNMLFGHLERPDIGFPDEEIVAGHFEHCAAQGLSPFAERSFLEFLAARHGIAMPEFAAVNEAIERIYPDGGQTDKITSAMRLVCKNAQAWAGGRGAFAELGFGRAPTVSSLLAHFFEAGYAVEPFAHRPERDEDARRIAQAVVRLDSRLPVRLRRLPLPGGAPGRLSLISRELGDADIPDGSLDFCFSITVLEHIARFEETFALLHRKMKPGGVMLHFVDFKDHGQAMPFRFYTQNVSDWRIRRMGTNLLRVNDMEAIFRRLGFAAQTSDAVLLDDLPANMHPFWNKYSRQDLTTATCLFRLTR